MRTSLILPILMVGVLSASGAGFTTSIALDGIQLGTNGNPIITVEIRLAAHAQVNVAEELEKSSFEVSGVSTSTIPLALTPKDRADLSKVQDGFRVTMWKEVNCEAIPDGSYAITLHSGEQRSNVAVFTINRQALAEAKKRSGGRLIVYPGKK